ncbi:MAG: 30S ribosomal protein S24e [archaeon]|nr:30S ribosomal protein S24e [archaeon]
MRVHIESKTQNPLLNRQEVSFTVKEAQATPSRQEIRKQVAAHTNADEKMLVVDVLKTSFGSTDLSGTARIYKSEEELKKTELPFIKVRNFGKEVEKKEEPKAAQGAEEKKE